MEKSTIFKTIYKNPNANTLMSVLLHFVSRMIHVPSSMFGISSGGSFVFGIAESLWSILTFRKQPDMFDSTDLAITLKEQYPLANQSLLLILILMNHWTTNNNSYRTSLFGCADSQCSPQDDSISFRIDFSTLYNTFCKIVTIDQATLLLYLMLHKNQRFYKYVMGQENLQNLVSDFIYNL